MAPGGHVDFYLGPLAVNLEAECFKRLAHVRFGQLQAHQLFDAVEIKRDHVLLDRRFAGYLFLRRRAAADLQHQAGREIQARLDKARIDAAFEAVAGIAGNAELAAGGGDGERIEVGALDEDVLRIRVAARRIRPHDATDVVGAAVVGDHAHALVELVGLAVQRFDLLALVRHARVDDALEFVGVVGVQRPAAVDHDVVGDIDGGVDGTRADGFQAPLHPGGRGAVLDALDRAAGEHRAIVRGVWREAQLDVDRDGVLALDSFQRLFRLQRAETGGGEIARDAAHARAVRAVRRQLHLDDDVREAEHVHIPTAHMLRHFGCHLDDAVVVLGELHLALRQHHPVRHHAAHGLGFERDAGARNIGAKRGEHADEAGLRIGRAANDFEGWLARLDLDLQHLQLVGVGMLLGLDDTRNGELRQRRRGIINALHLEPDLVEHATDLLDRRGRVEMLLEPVERELHGCGAP